MQAAFLDTSIVLRHILDDPNAYPNVPAFTKLYCSEIMRIEALRAIDRKRIQNSWHSKEVALRVGLLTAFNASVEFIPLQHPILKRAAEPFPTIVRTLDAIHIATALLAQDQLKKPLLFLTHDVKQGIAAQAAGLEAKGFNP